MVHHNGLNSVPREPLIIPAASRESWIGCIAHLRVQLALTDISQDWLRPYQQTILRDIEGGPCEAALAGMQDWIVDYRDAWIESWKERRWPVKPCIELTVEMTCKGNLIVAWRPSRSCDLDTSWIVARKIGERPSNELLYIRELGLALARYTSALRDLSDDQSRRREEARRYMLVMGGIDATLLLGAARLIEALIKRLRLLFEVNVLSNILLEWGAFSYGSLSKPSNRLIAWKIEDREEKDRRLELLELEGLPAKLGCSLQALLAAMETVWRKKRTGPAPANAGSDERVARQLRKAGNTSLTYSHVKRWRELLRKYYPEALPDWDRAPVLGPPEQAPSQISKMRALRAGRGYNG